MDAGSTAAQAPQHVDDDGQPFDAAGTVTVDGAFDVMLRNVKAVRAGCQES